MTLDDLQRDAAMTDEPSSALPTQKSSLVRLTIILFAGVALATAFSFWLGSREKRGGLQVGALMPELRAAGWLNGSAPSRAKLAGKVVVVNAWFTTCPNCHEQAPELVQLYKKYHDRGVVFIGLTFEPPEMLDDIKSTLGELKMTWTNGYGAPETLQDFDVTGFPSCWVIGPDGRVAWNLDSNKSLEAAIDEALAAAKAK